ncbi:hypothetical protein LTR15_003535 [Elasticomyces elasticus]|nr:hypothetical protein LTR15_003535 [Elasticomyces elasticus]
MHQHIRSVAIIGAAASGAAAAAALKAERHFDIIRVFERRETPGGTWIYDPDPGQSTAPTPGLLAPHLDPRSTVPANLPALLPPLDRERWEKTPVYEALTTNVPAVAMSFSDCPFPYGPFVPHWIPKQDIQDYLSRQGTDSLLALSTTVEDVTRLPHERWSLTLRKYDPTLRLDHWWREEFDALILANGHYSVPFIPAVPGLAEYIERYPRKVVHSKTYRTASSFAGRRVLVIGNSASGHDITMALTSGARLPVYQSRRSRSRWDGREPPSGVAWKPIVERYSANSGSILFVDGTSFAINDIDCVLYCTGYQSSFPFWNSRANDGPLWDYSNDRLIGTYLHTFFHKYPSLGIIGMPRTLTFRSFEYQAIALARMFAARNSIALRDRDDMKAWEMDRARRCRQERKKFHDIPWEEEETLEYYRSLSGIAGLPTLEGDGKCPPVLDESTRWAIENLRKYPEPGKNQDDGVLNGPEPGGGGASKLTDDGWIVVAADRPRGLQVLP